MRNHSSEGPQSTIKGITNKHLLITSQLRMIPTMLNKMKRLIRSNHTN